MLSDSRGPAYPLEAICPESNWPWTTNSCFSGGNNRRASSQPRSCAGRNPGVGRLVLLIGRAERRRAAGRTANSPFAAPYRPTHHRSLPSSFTSQQNNPEQTYRAGCRQGPDTILKHRPNLRRELDFRSFGNHPASRQLRPIVTDRSTTSEDVDRRKTIFDAVAHRLVCHRKHDQ